MSLRQHGHLPSIGVMKTRISNNSRQPTTRRVGIVAFPGSQILDITGPLAVFAEADQICQKRFNTGQAGYQVELISTGSDRLIECYCGVNLTARTDFRSVSGNFDTLLVAGGYGVLQADKVPGFLPWLPKMSRKTRRIGSVCSGSGEAGSTHHRIRSATALRRRLDRESFPRNGQRSESLFSGIFSESVRSQIE